MELSLGGGPYLWERKEKTDGSLYVAAELATLHGPIEVYIGTICAERSWHASAEIRFFRNDGNDAETVWSVEECDIATIDVLSDRLLAIKELLVRQCRDLDHENLLLRMRG